MEFPFKFVGGNKMEGFLPIVFHQKFTVSTRGKWTKVSIFASFTSLKSYAEKSPLHCNHLLNTVVFIQRSSFFSKVQNSYSCECSDWHVVQTLRMIAIQLQLSEGHGFSLRPHWISCTSAKCYFSEDQFAYKSFLLVWLSTANWTGLSGWWEAVTIAAVTGGNIH